MYHIYDVAFGPTENIFVVVSYECFAWNQFDATIWLVLNITYSYRLVISFLLSTSEFIV